MRKLANLKHEKQRLHLNYEIDLECFFARNGTPSILNENWCNSISHEQKPFINKMVVFLCQQLEKTTSIENSGQCLAITSK